MATTTGTTTPQPPTSKMTTTSLCLRARCRQQGVARPWPGVRGRCAGDVRVDGLRDLAVRGARTSTTLSVFASLLPPCPGANACVATTLPREPVRCHPPSRIPSSSRTIRSGTRASSCVGGCSSSAAFSSRFYHSFFDWVVAAFTAALVLYLLSLGTCCRKSMHAHHSGGYSQRLAAVAQR
jgi:hypothetical protein